MTTDTGGGVCLACRASPTRICAECHVRADNHTDDIDRALAAKDARIAELEEALADLQRWPDLPWAEASATIAQHAAFAARKGAQSDGKALIAALDKAKVYVDRILAERDRATRALEAEKAARVKVVEEEREACAATVEAAGTGLLLPASLRRIADSIRARDSGHREQPCVATEETAGNGVKTAALITTSAMLTGSAPPSPRSDTGNLAPKGDLGPVDQHRARGGGA